MTVKVTVRVLDITVTRTASRPPKGAKGFPTPPSYNPTVGNTADTTT